MMNKALKIARIQAELSQHKLSVSTGINQSLISVFGQGYRKPTKNQAKLIADALNTKPRALFRIPGKNDKTGKVLIKKSEFDCWMERFRSNDYLDPDTVADEVINSLNIVNSDF